jgi:hypothetical protein
MLICADSLRLDIKAEYRSNKDILLSVGNESEKNSMKFSIINTQ